MAYFKALFVLAALAAVASAGLIAANDDGSWWPGKYDPTVLAAAPGVLAAPGLLAARAGIAAPGLWAGAAPGLWAARAGLVAGHDDGSWWAGKYDPAVIAAGPAIAAHGW